MTLRCRACQWTHCQGLVTSSVSHRWYPTSIAADPANGTVWVANYAGNSLSEIRESTHRVIATVPVDDAPVAVTVDPAKKIVWVAYSGDGSGLVEAVNASTHAVIASGITVGAEPTGIAAGPKTGTVWVTNINGHGYVSEIKESTRSVVATVVTRVPPYAITADSTTGTVWVANYQANSVSAISEATAKVTATIRVGKHPLDIAVDSATGARRRWPPTLEARRSGWRTSPPIGYR
jgi:YVTN family beta-propeller protein